MNSSRGSLDPDTLLKVINDDEHARSNGKLRIFLGMSAGVGKTYAMLKAAHQKKSEGVDVVIGIVETHGRSETAILTSGLEVLSRKSVLYRDTQMEEMDLDAIISRKPKLVIVDELAHTNVPGQRHQKRYQDVIEILSHGIDVYTALNVQHIESRKDAVEAITGVRIRETVPDSILERAVQVELVDIAPMELLKRLHEGKVYHGDKAVTAADGFFKEDKLTALREIALRMTAERVDQDLQKFLVTKDERPWQTGERLLVAISHSPYSERLIRATRRLAYSLEAPWIAVHVDTGLQLRPEDQTQLTKNLNLARELKAEVITTTDADLTEALKRICRQKNVTQVIVGRSTRRWFRDVLEGGSLLKRLVRESNDVDVHVIRQDPSEQIHRLSLWQEISHYRTNTGWIKYWNTLWFLIAMTAFGAAVEPFVGYRTVGFIFLLGTLIVGLFGSLGAVMAAATLSALIWNIGFIPPRFTFEISQPDDIILCFAYFVVAMIVGFLTNRIRFHERIIREREERTLVLYRVLQDISSSQNKNEFIEKITHRVAQLLDAECDVILKNSDNVLKLDSLNGAFDFGEKEQAVALWSFQNRKEAGWSTETLGQSRSLYLPLKGVNEVVGVFVFKPRRKLNKLDPDQKTLLLSITGQLGVSIERHFLSKRLQEAQRVKDSEILHQTLLNSISHELRTPLTAILGSAAALDSELVKDDYVKKIALNISDSGGRLNQVIENLLDMSRLNSGILALKLEWQDLSDLVGVVLGKIAAATMSHKVSVDVMPDIELVRIDFRLFEHAISNLILNAVHYSPKGGMITIRIYRENNFVKLVVEDEGPGIPIEASAHIFEKFYRVPGSPPGGTGLGLSIVEGIVQLHKGRVYYKPNTKSSTKTGTCFVIELPLETQPHVPEESEL